MDGRHGLRTVVAGLAMALVTVLASCGGGSGGTASDEVGPSTTTTTAPVVDLPSACAAPPLTMGLEAGGTAPAGGASVAVADAVARRVPILPGVDASDAAELPALAEEAATTDLAAYTLYLSDAEIDRAELTGSGLGLLPAGPGTVVATLTIVPATAAGFAAGDVITDAAVPDLGSTTSFQSIGLTVFADGDATAQPYVDVEGSVTVLAVAGSVLCVDVDVRLTDAGALIYGASGVVAAPVVRAGAAFFFT